MAKLTNNERSPYTDTITLNAADLIAIGNGGTKIIGSIPAGGAVELVAVINTVDIVGSSWKYYGSCWFKTCKSCFRCNSYLHQSD